MTTKTHGHHHHGHESKAAKREESAERASAVGQKTDDPEKSHLIRVGAYSRWEQAGKPDGQAAQERFWFEAEQEFELCEAMD